MTGWAFDEIWDKSVEDTQDALAYIDAVAEAGKPKPEHPLTRGRQTGRR